MQIDLNEYASSSDDEECILVLDSSDDESTANTNNNTSETEMMKTETATTTTTTNTTEEQLHQEGDVKQMQKDQALPVVATPTANTIDGDEKMTSSSNSNESTSITTNSNLPYIIPKAALNHIRHDNDNQLSKLSENQQLEQQQHQHQQQQNATDATGTVPEGVNQEEANENNINHNNNNEDMTLTPEEEEMFQELRAMEDIAPEDDNMMEVEDLEDDNDDEANPFIEFGGKEQWDSEEEKEQDPDDYILDPQSGKRIRKLDDDDDPRKKLRVDVTGKYYKNADLLINQKTFARVAKAFCQEILFDAGINTEYSWKADALLALQNATETFMTEFFQDAYLIMTNRDNSYESTLLPQDMRTAAAIRSKFSQIDLNIMNSEEYQEPVINSVAWDQHEADSIPTMDGDDSDDGVTFITGHPGRGSDDSHHDPNMVVHFVPSSEDAVYQDRMEQKVNLLHQILSEKNILEDFLQQTAVVFEPKVNINKLPKIVKKGVKDVKSDEKHSITVISFTDSRQKRPSRKAATLTNKKDAVADLKNYFGFALPLSQKTFDRTYSPDYHKEAFLYALSPFKILYPPTLVPQYLTMKKEKGPSPHPCELILDKEKVEQLVDAVLDFVGSTNHRDIQGRVPQSTDPTSSSADNDKTNTEQLAAPSIIDQGSNVQSDTSSQQSQASTVGVNTQSSSTNQLSIAITQPKLNEMNVNNTDNNNSPDTPSLLEKQEVFGGTTATTTPAVKPPSAGQ